MLLDVVIIPVNETSQSAVVERFVLHQMNADQLEISVVAEPKSSHKVENE